MEECDDGNDINDDGYTDKSYNCLDKKTLQNFIITFEFQTSHKYKMVLEYIFGKLKYVLIIDLIKFYWLRKIIE